MTLRKSGSLVVVSIESLATAARCSFCFGSRSHGMNFATTCFMPRSCIKISDTVLILLGIPPSASSSCTVSHWSLLIAACTHSTFSGVLLVAGLPECGSLSTDSQTSSKHSCHTFICTALIASSPKAFWIIWIVPCSDECGSSLPQKSMQNHCSTQAFWMQWPHSTHAHSMVSATSTDEYSKVVIVHTCAFQSTLLHCQVTLILHKLFLLY